MKIAIGQKREDGSYFSVVRIGLDVCQIIDIDSLIDNNVLGTADALVQTQRGWNAVYLTGNDPPHSVIFEQDAVYLACSKIRGFWTLRTHGKEGTKRSMVGLTESGKVIAAEFNKAANEAPGININPSDFPSLTILEWPLRASS